MSASQDSITARIAQTNLQLFQQMRANGYSTAELIRVSDAYRLATQLFANQFRQCGRPFVAHLVGTSAVLVWLRAPVRIVIAALLHSCYQEGDFRKALEGMTPGKRALVRAVIGDEAEELVAAYTTGSRSQTGILRSHARFATLSACEREVLLMQLANELDDYRDLSSNYAANAQERLSVVQACGQQQVELAELLGYPELARALRETYAEARDAVMPAELTSAFENAYTVVPHSCRTRYNIRLRRLGVRIRNRVRRHLGVQLPW